MPVVENNTALDVIKFRKFQYTKQKFRSAEKTSYFNILL